MTPYRFPLQTVLDIRSNEEGQAREAYGKAARLMEEFNQRRLEVEASIEANLDECRRETSQPTSSGRVAQLRQMLEALRDKLKAMQPEAEVLQAALDERWAILVKARQKREALDKLQDRKREEHERESVRAEQKGLDEMITLREASRGSTWML
tara:strand:+ start:92 stop:550 length:459 start_codon:yes stop_codon:yes gene_type:complete